MIGTMGIGPHTPYGPYAFPTLRLSRPKIAVPSDDEPRATSVLQLHFRGHANGQALNDIDAQAWLANVLARINADSGRKPPAIPE